VKEANLEHPIPTLKELFEVVEPIGVTLVLELKNPRLYPGIEEQVLAFIDEFRMENRVIVVSFDLDSLERVSQINPAIETGQLYIHGFNMPRVKNTSLLEVFWLMPLIDPTFVWRQHRANRRVWVWTVDNPLLMRLLLWLGVDGITTNFPQRWPLENKNT
jgi:glycerophosphoryl diester phosphodiesterase